MKTYTTAELQAAMDTYRCRCWGCLQHPRHHGHAPVVVVGRTVHVDADLAPLVQAINDAGAVTGGSCTDLADLMRAIAPPAAIAAHAGRTGDGLHYGSVMRHRHAHVRFLRINDQANALADRLSATAAVATVRTGEVAGFPVVQVEFPINATSQLLEVVSA